MRVDLERCPPPFQKPMNMFHMKICEHLVSNPKSNHFYWAFFGWELSTLWDTPSIFENAQIASSFCFVREGKRKMNVFYHVWLVNGGTPTRQKSMKQMSSLGVWSSCVKIPAPMSNHGHGTQEPFQWEIHLKKTFFLLRVVRGVEIKVYWSCSFLACQGMRLYIYSTSFGPWISGFVQEISSFSWTASLFFLHVCIQYHPIWCTPAASFIGSFQNRSTCKGPPGPQTSVPNEVHHRLWTNERRSERYWCTFTDDGMLSETWMEKQDLYPACCGCGGGCCWRPRYQILPQLKLMLKER